MSNLPDTYRVPDDVRSEIKGKLRRLIQSSGASMEECARAFDHISKDDRIAFTPLLERLATERIRRDLAHRRLVRWLWVIKIAVVIGLAVYLLAKG